MGLLRFSLRRSPPPLAVNPPEPPPEFLCPISGELMSDPCILSSGETFDRISIQAFQDLSFNSSSSSSSSSSLVVIPNSALCAAILRWCDGAGVAHPIPLCYEMAVCCARRFLSCSSSKLVMQAKCLMELPNENCSFITCSSSSSDKHSSSCCCSNEIISIRSEKSGLLSCDMELQAKCSTELLKENSSSITYSSSSSSCSTEITPLKTQNSVLLSSNTTPHTSCSTELPNENTSSITSSSSSSSSTEITPKSVLFSLKTNPHTTCSTKLPNENPDPLEDEILHKLKNSQMQEQEAALISLLEATRESTSRRISLCTPTLLTSLRRLLLSRHPSIQSTALAIIVNLSLEPPNKIPIVRSGSLPSIINLLQSPTKNPHPNMYCFHKNFTF